MTSPPKIKKSLLRRGYKLGAYLGGGILDIQRGMDYIFHPVA